MENPMICFNYGRTEKDGTYSESSKYGMLGVIIHEVGHNFFPMIVNSDERQWSWMDEGLNSFCQFLAEQEWQRARRFKTSLALIVVDVDLFKSYNDALGHQAGDKCLAAVADVLLHAGRRAGDVVARYGGEEFVVLIPATDRKTALGFAERIRLACEERSIPHPASSVSPVVTISLGVAARVPTDGVPSSALMREADEALYRAKREGRNRVVCGSA